MKFNFTPRNIAIAILLVLTLVLGIISIVIATRLGQQPGDISVDSHGCQDFPPKNETWCEATKLCHGPDKPCESGEAPPSTTCQMLYQNGCVTRTSACSGSVTCERHTDKNDSATCSGGSGTVTIAPGQTVCTNPSCQTCDQIDCPGNGGVRRNNDNACTTPPPPVTLVCGDAKCRAGELCERTTAGGSTYKLCTAADRTAGRAPTGAAANCRISNCTLIETEEPPVMPPVEPPIIPPEQPPEPPPVSTPLPSTAVISDDFDRLLVGFMMVVLGLLAYRFNLFNKIFSNLNTLTSDDAIKNTALNKFLKTSRNSFEKNVENDFKKEK